MYPWLELSRRGTSELDFRGEQSVTRPEDQVFGAQLFQHRIRRGLSQEQVARLAGLSKSYLSEMENGKRLPPPRRTAIRIAQAMELAQPEADSLIAAAVYERGCAESDEELPTEVRQLIADIRSHAFQLPARVVLALHKKVREVVM